MDNLRPVSLCGLVIGTILLPLNTQGSFALDRPVHAAIPILASVGIAAALVPRILPKSLGGSNPAQRYSAVPLDDLGRPHGSREPSPDRNDTRQVSGPGKLRLVFFALVIALCLRVEILRRVLKDIQCAGFGYSELVPFAFAILDYWSVQRQAKNSTEDAHDGNIYNVVERRIMRSLYRCLIPTLLLGVSSLFITQTSIPPGSTYICPGLSSARRVLPALQILGSLLDFFLAFCADYLIRSGSAHQHGPGGRRFAAVGLAFVLASVVFCIAGVMYYVFVPDDRRWISTLPQHFAWSLVKLDSLVCLVVLSALLSISYYGAMTTAAVTVFVMTSTTALAWSWRDIHPFPSGPSGLSYLFFCLALLAFATYCNTHTSTESGHRPTQRSTTHPVSAWVYVLLLALFTVRTGLWFTKNPVANYHPIDMLTYQAAKQHETYLKLAHSSDDLKAAVTNYHQRYNRSPPPGFAQWYEYAVTRNATIIDDFDSINRDVLPFWALPPAEIRQRTWDAISNPWNDVAGISIRNGKAEISPNVMPTHRWMLDGIISMIDRFGQWLPDMDLGFNLNDECRVAVPYEKVEPMRDIGLRGADFNNQMKDEFSKERSETWKPIPEEPNPERPFREMSFQRTFYDFGNVGCPPNSPARTQRHWDTSRLCSSCTYPHSLGGFLANWTQSADICYQPDMANLHGLYLSPAAFKASHELLPVFSQSKAYGYNDILYPSAWNYMDKVKYDPNDEHPDPPFADKNNTLFWRGATSEGVSPGSGTWMGMARQRFIHLANNINDTTPPQPVLLLHKDGKRHAYASLSSATLTQHLATDVHIVDFIARCGGPDCEAQAQEFAPLATPSDFQSHWSYRYLLDLDGAGFSGRFLPFLHSRSLPFKAALFREWYDSRLTPWLHFVPLDLRGHGFWSTLAYFMGWEGRAGGGVVGAPAHEKEAEVIAEKGREWAGRVLRKEDMEIYFFRLLLEWGRLTDDRRDELGFTLKE